jgi:hypothetical protein
MKISFSASSDRAVPHSGRVVFVNIRMMHANIPDRNAYIWCDNDVVGYPSSDLTTVRYRIIGKIAIRYVIII